MKIKYKLQFLVLSVFLIVTCNNRIVENENKAIKINSFSVKNKSLITTIYLYKDSLIYYFDNRRDSILHIYSVVKNREIKQINVSEYLHNYIRFIFLKKDSIIIGAWFNKNDKKSNNSWITEYFLNDNSLTAIDTIGIYKTVVPPIISYHNDDYFYDLINARVNNIYSNRICDSLVFFTNNIYWHVDNNGIHITDKSKKEDFFIDFRRNYKYSRLILLIRNNNLICVEKSKQYTRIIMYKRSANDYIKIDERELKTHSYLSFYKKGFSLFENSKLTLIDFVPASYETLQD